MLPPVLQKVTFDTVHPFRRHPWLYALIGVVALGIVAVLIFAAWYGVDQKRLANMPPSGPVETPGERSNRLVIMNVLNAFHVQESSIEKTASEKDRLAAKKEHVEQVIAKLESLKAESSMQAAQNDVLSVFKQWDSKLQSGAATTDLKTDLTALAGKYPWLNTLLWIIILNRL